MRSGKSSFRPGADVTDLVRSKIMRANRAKDTGPEIRLRKALHAMGFRFRVNVRTLPGSPDVVLPKYRTALFVHGCYWHHHAGCKRATVPKQNADFWREKFERNRIRDAENTQALLALGWRVGVVWECAGDDATFRAVAAFIASAFPTFEDWPRSASTLCSAN